MIYLASAYSHDNPAIRDERFKAVCLCAAVLMRQGHLIFSPIAHTHPIAVAGELPTGWEFWHKYDREMIQACAQLWVFTLEGWKVSCGVTDELAIACAMLKPIRYVSTSYQITELPLA